MRRRRRRCERPTRSAANFGSHTATVLLHLFWVFLRLAQRDVEEAKRHVDGMLAATSPARDSDLMLSTFAQSLLAAHTDAPQCASAAERRHLEANARVGLFFGETMGTVLLAAQLAQFEPAEEVERVVVSAVAAIRNTYMGHVEAQLLLVQAYAELRRGRRARARELIDAAVSGDRNTNFFALRLIPNVLTWVFSFALSEGIGVAQVKTWIAHYQIAPGPEAPEHWPWPVRLYLLGGLRLVCRDQPLQFKRKAPQKPLELLVLLAAAGPAGLTSRAIADRLWPDLEADAAAVNVDTNVYRLRKLLGVEDALGQRQGPRRAQRDCDAGWTLGRSSGSRRNACMLPVKAWSKRRARRWSSTKARCWIRRASNRGRSPFASSSLGA